MNVFNSCSVNNVNSFLSVLKISLDTLIWLNVAKIISGFLLITWYKNCVTDFSRKARLKSLVNSKAYRLALPPLCTKCSAIMAIGQFWLHAMFPYMKYILTIYLNSQQYRF